MRRKAISIVLFFLLFKGLFGQGDIIYNAGKVSYITADNIYIKFNNTIEIDVGDTLYFNNIVSLIPCLIVTKKSSTSCVSKSINNCKIRINDEIIHVHYASITTDDISADTISDNIESLIQNEEIPDSLVPKRVSINSKNGIRGKVSASSYSSYSSIYDTRHRTMLRFSLSAHHINNSKFSLESYVNYRQDFKKNESNDRTNKYFRVYNLALSYDMNESTILTLGRKINNKVSSLGAIDGLQVEKYIGKSFYTGAIIGSRPDINDYGFNAKLFEYGAYFGFDNNEPKFYAQTTFGILEQRNSGAIDRRYIYLQHSSTLSRKVNLFGSLELDIYNKLLGISGAKPRLTNFFVSARYRFNRQLSFSVSYDSRKRIIFYETLKTEIERLLDDDQARQGLRFRVLVKPLKNINIGGSYSKRFQNNSQNKSNNFNGFINLSRLPGIGGRLNVNYNRNKSNYVDSQVLSFRYGRSVIDRFLDTDVYFRTVSYSYIQREITDSQNFIGLNLSFRMSRKWSLSVLGEHSTRKEENNYRFNSKLIRRF